MKFTFTFVEVFLFCILYVSPVLILLCAAITFMGLIIGKREKWSFSDSIYYAFVTATTVGYGDFHPMNKGSKYIAILIAIIGILMTGIIAAVGVKSIEVAFQEIHSN